MNIKDLHLENKELSVAHLKKSGEGFVISIHLKEGGELKKHTTAVPALLVCISGKTCYETIKGEKVLLQSGDYVHIEPHVEHWLIGLYESDLLLMK